MGKSGMDRREFLGATTKAALGVVVFQIMGCDKEETTGPGVVVNRNGSIESNHASGNEHKVIITKVQLDAGGELTLSIKGNADHDHTVTISAENMAKLKSGGVVHMLESASGGSPAHTHMVHFM
jgi:hypothetical protein